MRFRAIFWAVLLGLLATTTPLLLHAPLKANATGGPLAAFTYNPCVACAVIGNMVFFNGNWSISPNGPISTYTWDFGDGTPLAKTTTPTISHDYTQGLSTGLWQVTLTVQDSAGQTDTVSQTVMFGVQPTYTFQPQNPAVGQSVTFDASATQVYSPNSLLGFTWSFGDGASGSGKLTAHSYSSPGPYRVLLNVATSQGNAQISKTLTVGQAPPPPPPPVNIILRSVFGVAFYDSSGKITIQPATLFINMTVQGTNSTGTLFNISSGQITIGPSPTMPVQRNFTATSGQAFQYNYGRLTITAVMVETYSCQQYQPPCAIPSAVYQLYLTGPSRLVSTNSSLAFFTRLFGFLYNSQTKIGLFFVVGISPGDVNEDGRVNIFDLLTVGSCYSISTIQMSMSAPNSAPAGYSNAFYADVNGDGRVDLMDLTSVAGSFGQAY